MAARGAAGTLRAALVSVARQRDVAFECVVVGEGEDDATLVVAHEVARHDPRFRVLLRPEPSLPAALRYGLAACEAPLVARFDADDVMRRDRLALQVAALDAAPDLAGVGAHVRVFPQLGNDGLMRHARWLSTLTSADDVFRDRFVELPLAQPTWLVRRDVLESVGYRDAPWPEDYDWLLRALHAGHRLGVVPRRLVAWRDSATRCTRTDPRCLPEQLLACKAHFLARSFLARVSEYTLWGHGDTGRALRRALAVEGRAAALIVEIDPRKVGQRIGGAPVVSPDALHQHPLRPIVASVSGVSARGDLRTRAAGLGLVEGVHFVCAA